MRAGAVLRLAVRHAVHVLDRHRLRFFLLPEAESWLAGSVLHSDAQFPGYFSASPVEARYISDAA